MPRTMEIATPLGEDVLLFHGMTAHEEMSRPFEYQVDLLSARDDINLDEILGKNVTITLALLNDETRFWNGFVTRFSEGDTHGRLRRYHATVRPWFWFLTRTSDCRIFQEQTVPDIIKEVFADLGMAEFKFELTSTYRKWPYCVQYRETDFAFVSRLMEHEGIGYHFIHSNGHHTLVLTDSTSMHSPTPGCETLSFVARAEHVRPDLERVRSWDLSREIQPGVYVHDDYDFERPAVKLRTRQIRPRDYTPSDFEVYDYPGLYTQKPDGEQYAAVRIDELASQFEVAQATTNARGLTVGSLLTLEDHPRADQNREYLIVGADYELLFEEYESIRDPRPTSYGCSFSAMPSSQQFRPRRRTRKPFVQGPQTAVVVGPAQDEIFTDEHGRVKVQFRWDRRGTEDENSSCFIRVSQVWAGKGWGAIHTPRVGHEVIVDFLEGDPDQPIIVGRVYNAVNTPPYTLPENKTQSGVKSRSTLGGTPENFNEIRFEDKKGKEHVVIHAERNLNILAKANERKTIGNDSSTTVGNNSTVTVGTDPKGDPKKNGKVTTTIFGDTSTTITKGDLKLDVQTGKMTVHVKGIVEETFDDTSKLTVANEIKLICGASSITMKKDGTIEIVGVNIKVNGSASIAVDSAKIDSVASAAHTIKGTMVKVNGSANVAVDAPIINSVASGIHTIKGAMVKVNGSANVAVDAPIINSVASGVHTIKGAIVLINS